MAQKAVKSKKAKSTKKTKKVVKNAIVYIKSTFNNTHVTVTDTQGNVLTSVSTGNMGFKGTRQSTPYAAEVAAKGAMEKASIYKIENIKVRVKGVGAGREQALRGLTANNDIEINSITDITPIPHGGCRPKRQRKP